MYSLQILKQRIVNVLCNVFSTREVLVEVIKDIGFSQSDITELKNLYPIKQHRKGMTLEDHAEIAGQQKVITSLQNIINRRSGYVRG